MVDTYARMRQLIGTTSNWQTNNIVIGDGEIAVERTSTGTLKMKVGNGLSPFSDLPYVEGQFNLTELDARYVNEVDTTNVGGPVNANKITRLNGVGRLDMSMIDLTQTTGLDGRYVNETETRTEGGAGSENLWPRLNAAGRLNVSFIDPANLDARFVNEVDVTDVGGAAYGGRVIKLDPDGKLDPSMFDYNDLDGQYVNITDTFQEGGEHAANMWPRLSGDGKLDGSLIRTSLLAYRGQVHSQTQPPPLPPIGGDFYMQDSDGTVGAGWGAATGLAIGKGDFLSYSDFAGWEIYDSQIDPEAYVKRDGDYMFGKLVTADSTIDRSGFRILPGTAPTAPLDGDLWTTNTGIFTRINGSTYPLLLAGGRGLFADGSATAPSIAFIADPDTGIFRTAANQIGFTTNGVTRAVLGETGNWTMGAILNTGLGVSTQDVAIEIGQFRTDNGVSYIDFHSRAGVDFDFRIHRGAGQNGTVEFNQQGTGQINWFLNSVFKGYMDSGGFTYFGSIGTAYDGNNNGRLVMQSNSDFVMYLTIAGNTNWIWGINNVLGPFRFNVPVYSAQFQAANGTAAAPSYSFTNHASTGWFLESAGQMNAATSGIDRMSFLVGGSAAFYGHANQILLKPSKSGNDRTVMLRNDGSRFYFLISDPSTAPSGVWNTLRPFSFDVASGRVYLENGQEMYGGLHSTGTISVDGAGGVAQVRSNGDLSAHRGNNSGVVFLGINGDRYLHFDGANYILPGANLYVNGSQVWTSGLDTVNTATKHFQGGGGIIWGNPWASLQAYCADGGGAMMAFLREAAYGIFWGLDPDNVMRLGGWSSGTRMAIDTGGTVIFSGNVGAYSDERLKRNWRSVRSDFVDRLAELKSGIFDRVDHPATQVGIGAQSLQQFFPEAVTEGDNGILVVNQGGAALVSVVELAKEILGLKKRIQELEARP